jgi:hypothetical protein
MYKRMLDEFLWLKRIISQPKSSPAAQDTLAQRLGFPSSRLGDLILNQPKRVMFNGS